MIELLYILAAWRLTSLYANEDGPFDVIRKLREFVGVYCFMCVSVWFGVLVGALVHQSILIGLAYSAGAIIIEEILCAVDARSGSIQK